MKLWKRIATLAGCTQQQEPQVDVNHPPEIVYAYPSIPIYFKSIANNLEKYLAYPRILLGRIVDKDGDLMNIQFWLKSINDNSWKGVGNFEGYNGTYWVNTPNIPYATDENPRWYQWKLDVSDGNDSISKTYNFFTWT